MLPFLHLTPFSIGVNSKGNNLLLYDDITSCLPLEKGGKDMEVY